MIQNLFFFFFFFLRGVGSLSQPRLNIFTVGNMRVMIYLGQGGLRSLSASSLVSIWMICLNYPQFELFCMNLSQFERFYLNFYLHLNDLVWICPHLKSIVLEVDMISKLAFGAWVWILRLMKWWKRQSRHLSFYCIHVFKYTHNYYCHEIRSNSRVNQLQGWPKR